VNDSGLEDTVIYVVILLAVLLSLALLFQVSKSPWFGTL
jgi:uncharacterized protein YpmB